MLDKVIMLPAAMFLIFLFAFFAVAGVGMFTKWAIIQNEAQFVAASMGKWGGYTQDAEDSVKDFAQKMGVSRRKVEIDANAYGPINWGRPIQVTVEVPVKFEVGSYSVGTYYLKGYGKSVSSYLPGAYENVRYMTP